MRTGFVTVIVSACSLPSQAAPQTQYAVVPAAYANGDAVSYEWIAGASRDLRQQTVVGAAHLASTVAGHYITALELRRNSANEVYAGGTTTMVVTLSTSPRLPLTVADAYAANTGPDALTVFQGLVALPTSPANANSAVGWTPSNTVRIAFQQPFHYQGGTLCVDIVGTRMSGQEANWWMADAEFENIGGTVVQLGPGCGAYGGAQGEWSEIARRSLLPGTYAHFWAYGPPNSIGFVCFGAASPAPISLVSLGLPTPNCYSYLQPGAILAAVIVPFVPEADPSLLGRGGVADYRLHLPDQSWMFGMQLTTQWFEPSQLASSNGITWTVASGMPTLDMALVEGSPSEPKGEVSVHLAHVMRFEYQ
jgi:hypothetical protein